jgi:DNA-binding MarR family transcriptional regulator
MERNKMNAANARDLDKFRKYNLGWLLLEISHDFFNRSSREFHKRGITDLSAAHSNVLIHLPLDGARITELASQAGVTKQAISLIVDELERLRYVERVPDPSDGRAKLVRFTKGGLTLLGQSREIVTNVWGQYAEALGKRRLDNLHRELEALLENVTKDKNRQNLTHTG